MNTRVQIDSAVAARLPMPAVFDLGAYR